MADLDAQISSALDTLRETEGDGGSESSADVFGSGSTAEAVNVDEAIVAADVTPAANTVADKTTHPVVDKATTPVVEKVVNPNEETDFSKIPERDAQGHFNRIPHPRVKQMVESAGKRAVDDFTKASHEPVVRQNQEYVDRLDRIAHVEHIMFNKPEQMLDILDTIPGYKQAWEKRFGKTAGAPAVDKAVPAVGADDPEPGPDVMDDKGAPVGYSEKGLRALRAWDRRQAANDAEKVFEQKHGGTLKTIQDREKAREDYTARSNGVATDLERAAKWDGFVDNAEEILKVLKDDGEQAAAAERKRPGSGRLKFSLLDAYHHVVLPKFKGDKQRVREEVIKEFQIAPKSTSAGGAAAVSRQAAAGTPKSLDDIIKANLDKLRGTEG